MITFTPTTPSTSSQQSSDSSSSSNASQSKFSIQQFENELAALVNTALQAAGISPSQATFSFSPAASPVASSTTSTTSDSASASADIAPPGHGRNPVTGLNNGIRAYSSLLMNSSATEQTVATSPATATSNAVASTTAPAPAATTPAATDPATPAIVLSPASAPVVGTEGMVWNPNNGRFGGLGAAPITDMDMWRNTATGQSVSADLVIAGFKKIYGGDTPNLLDALMGQWGQAAEQDALQKDPSLGDGNPNPMRHGDLTLFEQYGAWGSFQDPTTNQTSYFDANGQEYPVNTGPALTAHLFTPTGYTNEAGWNNPVSL